MRWATFSAPDAIAAMQICVLIVPQRTKSADIVTLCQTMSRGMLPPGCGIMEHHRASVLVSSGPFNLDE